MLGDSDSIELGTGHIVYNKCSECGSKQLELVELADSEGDLFVYVCRECGWQRNATVTNCTVTFEQVAKVRESLVGDVDPAEIEQAAKAVQRALEQSLFTLRGDI